MIPIANIRQWRQYAPWLLDSQVEQDLALSRALVEIYSDPLLSNEFAFRGGTALNKLFISPPSRYSEDIDLVRIKTGKIGEAIDTIRDKLDPWLGDPKYKRGHARFTLIYRFNSSTAPVIPLRLKIEINTREKDPVIGLSYKEFSVSNPWFSGNCEITTYPLEELLATKFCALYQRKKGRDLFDLIIASKLFPNIDHKNIVNIASQYFKHDNVKLTKALFEENIFLKLADSSFIQDTTPLLPENNNIFEPTRDFSQFSSNYITHLPGEPWKGRI